MKKGCTARLRHIVGLPLVILLLHVAIVVRSTSVAVAADACVLGHPVENFETLDKMPAPLAADFLAHLTSVIPSRPLIAAPGEAFDVGDVISDRSAASRRFIRGGHDKRSSNDLWFIWYEHGGRGYHVHVVMYEYRPGVPPRVVANAVAAAERICEQTDDFLDVWWTADW